MTIRMKSGMRNGFHWKRSLVLPLALAPFLLVVPTKPPQPGPGPLLVVVLRIAGSEQGREESAAVLLAVLGSAVLLLFL